MSKLCKYGSIAGLMAYGLLSAPLWGQTAAPADPAPATSPAATPAGQDAADPPPPRFDPRQRMLDHLQLRLGMSSDEFKAVKPQLENLLALDSDTHPRPGGGPGGGPGGPGFRGGPPFGGPGGQGFRGGPPFGGPDGGGPDQGPGGPGGELGGPGGGPGGDNAGPPSGGPGGGPDGGGSGGLPEKDGNRRPPRQESDVQKKLMDLRRTLDDSDSPADEVKTKLDAYEEALNKAKVELSTAQGEVRKLMTPRQEAVLISMGLLD